MGGQGGRLFACGIVNDQNRGDGRGIAPAGNRGTRRVLSKVLRLAFESCSKVARTLNDKSNREAQTLNDKSNHRKNNARVFSAWVLISMMGLPVNLSTEAYTCNNSGESALVPLACFLCQSAVARSAETIVKRAAASSGTTSPLGS